MGSEEAIENLSHDIATIREIESYLTVVSKEWILYAKPLIPELIVERWRMLRGDS